MARRGLVGGDGELDAGRAATARLAARAPASAAIATARAACDERPGESIHDRLADE